MAKDTQSRKWQITINKPEEKGYTHEKIKEILGEFSNVIYWCMADEIGEQGTYHTHLYLQTKNGIRFSTIQNKFSGGHFEMANGTAQQNRDYVFKEGKWANDKKADTKVSGTQEEFGELPIERQGQRNDIHDLYDKIEHGWTNAQILEDNPETMFTLQYIDRVREILRQKEYGDTWRDVEVSYIYGETGTGKTRGIYKEHGMGNVFRITDYKNAFDLYNGQDVLVFDEFRSDFRIAQMLNFLDGYPLELPARFFNRTACFTKVYIVSNISLSEQYRNIQREEPETWRAFLRRIGHVVIYEGGQQIKLTTDEYINSQGYEYFRTDSEIENILNLAHIRNEKSHTANAAKG